MSRSSVATVALALALVLGYGWHQRTLGRAEAATAVYRRANDSLQLVQRAVDTVYRRDTVTLWRSVRRLDTMTVTVEQWKHDTLKVVEYVARADSTVAACTATVLICEQRVGVRDERIRALEGQINAMPKPRGALWVWAERLAIGYGSYTIGRATVKR